MDLSQGGESEAHLFLESLPFLWLGSVGAGDIWGFVQCMYASSDGSLCLQSLVCFGEINTFERAGAPEEMSECQA